LLDTGQVASAEDPLREALAIRQQLFVSGGLVRSQDRYLGRVYANLGRALAAAGQTTEAERSYREAAKLLEALVSDFRDRMFARKDLAEALGGLADLLGSLGRQREVEALRRQVLRHYEIMTKDFEEDPFNRRNLAQSHLQLGILLCETGRSAEGAVQFRQALKVDPASGAAHDRLAWFLATVAEPSLQDAAEAVRLAQKAVAAEPKSGNYRNTLGVARYRHGDDKGAVAGLEESMRLREGGTATTGSSWPWRTGAWGTATRRARCSTAP
jgi:tetratricopeptide (TPR) repeat protein